MDHHPSLPGNKLRQILLESAATIRDAPNVWLAEIIQRKIAKTTLSVTNLKGRIFFTEQGHFEDAINNNS